MRCSKRATARSYRNHIAVYHQWSEERAEIEDALADLGREGGFVVRWGCRDDG